VTSAVALTPPGSRGQTLSLFDTAGGEPTLDAVLAGVWEGLAGRATAACPVCGGPMEAMHPSRSDERTREGHRARAPESARCTSCGSSLS
jgi:hypothetical protein